MKKRRHLERTERAHVTSSNTGTLVLDGETLPAALKHAIALAEIGHSICRITHKNKKVAIVRAEWIPLICKLETGVFSHAELVALDKMAVFDEEHTTKKRSEEIVAWAKSLGAE